MKLIFHYIKRHFVLFTICILFLTLEAMADLLQPTFMSFIVDRGVADRSPEEILHYGAIMLGIAAIGLVGALSRNFLSGYTSMKISAELRSDLYAHVQSLSLENIDHLEPASIITRITNDVQQIQEFVNSCMRILVKAPITCVGAIVLLVLETPRDLGVILFVLAVSFLFIWLNMKIGYPRFGRMQESLDLLNGDSREFLSSIRVVKAFRAEDEERRKFREASTSLARTTTTAKQTTAVFNPLINLTVNLGIVLLLWISGISGAGNIGRTMAAVNYMTQILHSLNMASNFLNRATRAAASADRVSEIFEERPAQSPAPEIDLSGDTAPEHAGEAPAKGTARTGTAAAPEPAAVPRLGGGVCFDHVSFTYRGCPNPSLSDITFTVTPGQTIGVIGPTGSGKSTLVSLIPRLYDATEGCVFLDGLDVRSIPFSVLHRDIATAAQKPLLFSGTIEENIRWGKEDASMEEVREAARAARAEEFILEKPDGYSEMLGQGGSGLSGGQRQRLSLARALIRKPSILILDDVTSALDADTESAVLRNLAAIKDTTVFLISQRISTVRRADRILVLGDGRMQGFGTHEALLQSCEGYRAIYRSQIGDVPDAGIGGKEDV